MVLGINDATWFTEGWLGAHAPVGRCVYTAGLVIAAVTLLLLFLAMCRRRSPHASRSTDLLWRTSSGVCLFLLTDFGFVSFYGLSFIGDALRLIYWIIPLGVWSFYTRPHRSADRGRWLAVRSRLLVMHAPGLPLGLITLVSVISRGLIGLAVYVLGCNLLALGYLGIADRRRTGPVTAPYRDPAPIDIL